MGNKRDYLIKRDQNKQKKLAAGLLSESYPKVSTIFIHMTYIQKQSEKIFLDRTINFSPESYAYFSMECFTKECVDGGFELTPVIKRMVRERKKTGKGELVCKGKNTPPSKGHISMTYEIKIKYKRK